MEKRIGAEKARWSYAWKTMGDLGIHTAGVIRQSCGVLQSPVGMHAAITRQDHQGYPPRGWHPMERLSPKNALALLTQGSAYAAHEERIKGSLSPGKLADFVILPADPTEVPPDEL